MAKTIYQEGNSFLHRLNPFTSIVVSISLAALVFIVPDYRVALAIFLLLLPLTVISGVYRQVLPLAGVVLLPLFFFLILIQGILNPEHHGTVALVEIGPITIWQAGFETARLVALRIATLVIAILLMATTSHPSRARVSLIEHGLPPKIAYVLLAALQAIPELLDRAKDITTAQQARGLDTKGSITSRVKGIQALMLPLMISTLMLANTRALALSSRGFERTNSRTFLYDVPDPAWERAVRRVAVGGVVIALILRLVWYVI